MLPSDRRLRCLVIDANDWRGKVLSALLASISGERRVVGSLHAARDAIEREAPELIFIHSDQLPARLQADCLREGLPAASVLIVIASGAARSSLLHAAGVDAVLHEPFGTADLGRVADLAAELAGLATEIDRGRYRGLSAIRQFAIESIGAIEHEALLTSLLDLGRTTLRARAAAVWDLSADTGGLRCLGAAGLPSGYIANLEQRSVGRAAEVAHAVLYDYYPYIDLTRETDRYVLPIDPRAARAAGIARTIWLPVRDRSSLLGLLSIYLADAGGSVDILLAEGLTATVATVLGTARLRRELTINELLYRELVERLPTGMAVCDLDGHIRLVNPAFAALAGRTEGALLGQDVHQLFTDARAVPWRLWSGGAPERDLAPVLLTLITGDGRQTFVEARGRSIVLPGGSELDDAALRRVQITLEDVTAAQRRLHHLQLLHDLTRHVSERKDPVVAFNMVAERLVAELGYWIVELATISDDGRQLIAQASSGPIADSAGQVWDPYSGVIGRALRENRSVLVPDVSRDLDYVDMYPGVLSEIVAVIRADGRPIGILNILTDEARQLDEDDLALVESIATHLGLLLEQVSLTDELARQAMTDPLLGCANRRVLIERLQSLTTDRRVTSGALLFIDLDNFKSVNDAHGHLMADALLVEVVRRLGAEIRAGDLLARYAGDELAILLAGSDAAGAWEVADRLRTTISNEPFILPSGAPVRLSASIGIGLYPDDGATPDALLAAADRAMYLAKARGRDICWGSFMEPAASD